VTPREQKQIQDALEVARRVLGLLVANHTSDLGRLISRVIVDKLGGLMAVEDAAATLKRISGVDVQTVTDQAALIAEVRNVVGTAELGWHVDLGEKINRRLAELIGVRFEPDSHGVQPDEIKRLRRESVALVRTMAAEGEDGVEPSRLWAWRQQAIHLAAQLKATGDTTR
jgi:ribosomal protein L29